MAPGQPPLGSPSGGRTPGPGARGQGLSTGAPRMRPEGSGGGASTQERSSVGVRSNQLEVGQTPSWGLSQPHP